MLSLGQDRFRLIDTLSLLGLVIERKVDGRGESHHVLKIPALFGQVCTEGEVRIVFLFGQMDPGLGRADHQLPGFNLRSMFIRCLDQFIHAVGIHGFIGFRGLPQRRSCFPSCGAVEHGLHGFHFLLQHLFLFEEHILFRLGHEELLLRRHARSVPCRGRILHPREKGGLIPDDVDIPVCEEEIKVELFDPGDGLQPYSLIVGFEALCVFCGHLLLDGKFPRKRKHL